MKLHRFFVSPEAVSGKIFSLTDNEQCHQITAVLKLKIGEQIIALDNTGKEYLVRLEKITKTKIDGVITSTGENPNEPNIKITLYQSMIKKDNFEWVLQKGTELGVSAFVPMLSERSEKKSFNYERGLKILKEAAEQSECGTIPTLEQPTNFTEVLKNKNIFLLDRSGAPLKSLNLESVEEINLLIGPEGGWSEAEIASAKASGASVVSIGPRTLRAETAGPIAAALILNQ